MSKEKARAHFLGQYGHRKLNCAQAIINAFKEKFSLSDDLITQCEEYGGGRAPKGYCGALYAAKVILENRHPGKFKECESLFLDQAGSTKCGAIRSSRRLTCVGCVEKVAEGLETI